MDNLGKHAIHIYTDFGGYISAYCKYISGTESYEITSETINNEGKIVSNWIPCNEVKIID